MKEILIPLNFTTTPVLYDSKQSFSASDESSGVLTFTTTANVTGTVASLTLRNASDNANRQTILVERLDINSSPFRYTIVKPLPFGNYEGEITLKKGTQIIASAVFLFGVNSSLSASVLPKLVEAYSLDALVEEVETEVSNLKDAYTLTVSETVKGVNKTESTLQLSENVRYLNEATRKANELLRISQEAARVVAEGDRVTEFGNLVDSAVIEQIVTQEVAEKYQEIEATQDNRLLSAEQQLAEATQTLNEIEPLAQSDYVAILEQNFSDLVEGRLITKPNTIQKNVAKQGTVTSGKILVDDTFSNLTRIHTIKDGVAELFENVDYTVDLFANKIKFPYTYTLARYEESVFTFGTGWIAYTQASLSGGADKYIKKTTAIANPTHGATLTATFTTFYFVTRKGNTEGIAKITIDGVEYLVDCYDPASVLYQQKTLVVDGLANVSHTVKVEHSGTNNPLSTGNLTVHFDAVEYGTRQSSPYEGKLLDYKIDYIAYQGQLSGIGTIEGEDKFRFKILHAPDYAYLITDKSRANPFPNASSVVFSGSEFKKVKYDTSNTGFSKIAEGQKYFVKSSSAGTNTTFGTIELENGINPFIHESYGTLTIPQPRMIAKPVLIVVTDSCRSDFEVGEVALAMFTDVRNDLTIDLNQPGMNLFKINQKLKMNMVNIVTYGDSITACTYLKNFQSYSEQLETLLKKSVSKVINVINKGDNGDKTTDLITTMYQVTEQEPDHVIVASGTNDQGYAVSLVDYRANLITLITAFQNIGAKVLLLNMPHVDYPTHYDSDRNAAFAPYLTVLSEVATEYELPLIDINSRFATEISNGNWDLFYHNDGTGGYTLVDPRINYVGFYKNIHPNAYGQAIIAEEAVESLLPLLI